MELVKARSAYALFTAAMMSFALAWPSAAPAAFAGRNGDLLFAKQRYAQTRGAGHLRDPARGRLGPAPDAHEVG